MIAYYVEAANMQNNFHDAKSSIGSMDENLLLMGNNLELHIWSVALKDP